MACGIQISFLRTTVITKHVASLSHELIFFVGASNFVPSWMYWQKIPRSLQYPKTVILHRKENASWGFSIVGGADPGSGRPVESIHVLFVVPDSPASKDGKLK